MSSAHGVARHCLCHPLLCISYNDDEDPGFVLLLLIIAQRSTLDRVQLNGEI